MLVLRNRPCHWVNLKDVEGTARLQKVCRNFRPTVDVLQPADCTDAGVNDVELPIWKHGRRLVQISDNKLSGCPRLCAEPSARLDSRLGKINAGDIRAKTSPAQRVVTDVALKMQQRLARNITQFVMIEIELDYVADVLRVIDKLLDLVVIRVPVNRHPVVPVVPIRRAVFVSGM